MVQIDASYKACFIIFTGSTAACANFNNLLVQARLFFVLNLAGSGVVLVSLHMADVQLCLGSCMSAFSLVVWFLCLLFDFSVLALC